MKQRPLFITFEGCEGSGKSTQTELLLQWLSNNGINCLSTREPGGTPAGEAIRDILLNEQIDLKTKSELLLHTCARLEHVENVIKPALAQNKIVLCDRYLDSTKAYQGYGNRIDMKVIEKLHEMIVDNFQPDLTFILDIDLHTLRERLKNSQERNKHDRYENRNDDYHLRVAEGYRDIAKKDPQRCALINATNSIDDIQFTIRTKVESILN